MQNMHHQHAHCKSKHTLIRLSVIEIGSVTQEITGGVGLHAKSTLSGSPDTASADWEVYSPHARREYQIQLGSRNTLL